MGRGSMPQKKGGGPAFLGFPPLKFYDIFTLVCL